ncbi:Uncharacterised protein [Mycobacteroides abscessus subsp. abscessus]|nr:Uncharacterised protein [Mycobacteroides abscessus subsp. abscessus]
MVNSPVSTIMLTSACPRSRRAAPARTSNRPNTCGLDAACIRASVSGNRTTPIAAVRASADPNNTSTPEIASRNAFIAAYSWGRRGLLRCRAPGIESRLPNPGS